MFIEGGEADELRDVVSHFAISQDQRNTVAGQLRLEAHSRAWFAVHAFLPHHRSMLRVEVKPGLRWIGILHAQHRQCAQAILVVVIGVVFV